ncbi:MAG: FecR domain-containing protein [Bradyrhizobium sp.]|nr:FecR domain-containing protein [Bradyrhizobium sp.]
MRAAHHVSRLLTATYFVAAASGAFAADDGKWTVSKSSGDVWLTNAGAQPASLKQDEFLKPGETIRTGKNGRVLLKRGEESMMIAPNSVVGVPAEKKEGLTTTIVQQAGSILLDVEKRNVKHFEVETPYLAAVVKGTQFRVTVNATGTSVDVIRGQVEVADFRTGQIAQVKPGQHAATFAHGKSGLSLGGSGTLSPIEHGKPRTPSIERVPVPRAGFTAPRNATIGQAPGKAAQGTADKISNKASHRAAGMTVPKHGGIRISSAIGEVKLNVHKVTNGLARDKSAAHGGNRSAANKDTVWGSSGSGTNSTATAINSGNAATTSAATSPSAASSVTSTVAAVTGSGNGNGNNGNGNGNGGANGNGNGNGHGKNK